MDFTDAVIVVCSVVGILVSSYFTLVYYRLLKPDAVFIPPVCRMDAATCQRIMEKRDAKLLGVPNFIVGLLYYSGLLFYIFSGSHSGSMTMLHLATFAAFFTVVLGVYLIYALRIKLRIHCVLCYTSHACNFIILIALLAKHFP